MPAIIVAAPIVGKSALYPGNAVRSEKAKREKSKAKPPNQTDIVFAIFRLLLKRSGMKRRSAPIPNSQALVGSE